MRRCALANHVQGASRCFVSCRDERVVGYYALASASVQHGDTARAFYRHFDFEPSPTDSLHLLLIKDARAIVGSPLDFVSGGQANREAPQLWHGHG